MSVTRTYGGVKGQIVTGRDKKPAFRTLWTASIQQNYKKKNHFDKTDVFIQQKLVNQ